MTNFNEHYLNGQEECNEFIRYWNDIIDEYGFISVGDVMPFIGIKEEPTREDYSLGWTRPITTDDFEIELVKRKCSIFCNCRINLPEPKFI